MQRHTSHVRQIAVEAVLGARFKRLAFPDAPPPGAPEMIAYWDAPIQRNGLISQPFIDQLTAVGKALGRR